MLHHWTIYDSMFYSRHVAAKLGLWKENGAEGINYLLAKMTIPTNEASQPWSSVEQNIQKVFHEKFRTHAIQRVGEEVEFGSFTKQHGDFQSIRAADMVFALTALLENENKYSEDEDSGKKNTDKNFKQSMDALEVNNIEILRTGIHLAIKFRKKVADKALEIVNKNRVVSSGAFRYIDITEKTDFYTPLAITQLANWIQHINSERKNIQKGGSSSRAKPFICAVYNEETNKYTICGIPSRKRSDLKNRFGSCFEKAALSVRARVQKITFEEYKIEIQKDDWSKFLEKLHSEAIDLL